jgi:hypothetical protein
MLLRNQPDRQILPSLKCLLGLPADFTALLGDKISAIFTTLNS